METREERGGVPRGDSFGVDPLVRSMGSMRYRRMSCRVYSKIYHIRENFPSFHLIFFLEKKKERRKYRFLNFINIKYQ